MRVWDATSLSTSLWETGLMLGIEVSVLVIAGFIVTKLICRAGVRRAVWCGIILTIAMVALAELTGIVRATPMFWSIENGGIVEPTSSVSSSPGTMSPFNNAKTGTPRVQSVSVSTTGSWNWSKALVLVWVSISAIFVSVLLVAHALLWRLRRRMQPLKSDGRVRHLAEQLNAPTNIRAGTCAGVNSPFVFGLWRPTMALPICYPEELNVSHQDAIVVHELMHLTNRDPWWQLAADATVALLWWHPGSWIARTMFRRSAEHAADEATAILPDGPVLLAESLVALGRRQLRHQWCAGLAVQGRPSTWLSQRVLTLLEMTPPHPQRFSRWRWLRPIVLATTIIAVMVGAAGARTDAFAEGTKMRLSKTWRNSLVSLAVLAAWSDPAPAQGLAAPARTAASGGPASIASAGKSEEASMHAVSLTDEQRRQFLAAKDVRSESTKKMHAMTADAERMETGKTIGAKWRDDLRKIMSAEQYSRYVEYWQTNNVAMKRGDAGYTIVISAHPLNANAKLAAGLNLSAEQTEILIRLKDSLSKEIAEIQELAQTPAKLPEVTNRLAAVQRRRNEALQEIFTEDQYARYRRDLDAIVETDMNASRVAAPSGARIAAPVKKN